MQRATITVDDLSIDPRKADYLRTVHQVEVADVFEVFNNTPLYFAYDNNWGLYNMIGPALSGRFMVVAIQRATGNYWRVVTAYWNTDGRAEKEYRG